MKLWHSFTKELLLASRSFYFYIEVVMAGIFLFLLLFVIPETFEGRQDQYLFYDVPEAVFEVFEEDIIGEDEDGVGEAVELELNDEIATGTLYQTDNTNLYVMDDKDQAIALADEERAFAAVVHMDDAGKVTYTYYMQGYETERLLNTFALFHSEDVEVLRGAFEDQEVRVLHEDQVILGDRENIIPSFLTFNGSLMGMFILASYIFLDKKEGVIKAYAVTTSPVWQYLLSKTGVVTVTSIVTSLVIATPIMGSQPNYGALLFLLLTTGFAASSLGLLISTYYDDIAQSFGIMFVLIMGMMLPNIAYFIPTWSPDWMQYIPTYSMLEGFKESILINGDINYVMMVSSGFLIGGLVLFLIANTRFKKTLTI